MVYAVNLDYSVYPDIDELPDDLPTPEAKADYIARICGAWDFGIGPTAYTFELLRDWKPVFDAFPIADSPAYHAFRTVFGWPGIDGVQNAAYEFDADTTPA
jgi:hypothetical protein